MRYFANTIFIIISLGRCINIKIAMRKVNEDDETDDMTTTSTKETGW